MATLLYTIDNVKYHIIIVRLNIWIKGMYTISKIVFIRLSLDVRFWCLYRCNEMNRALGHLCADIG